MFLCLSSFIYRLFFFIILFSFSFSFIPVDWQSSIHNNHRLFSKDLSSSPRFQYNSSPLLIPSIGNGYLATVIGSTTVYIGGLYNGKNINGLDLTLPSHRARIPALLNINITNGIIDYKNKDINKDYYGGFAIDIKEGVFYERFFVGHKSKVQIEQRRYCHRRYSSLIIHEIHIDNTISPNPEKIDLNLSLNYGEPSPDINFTDTQETSDYLIFKGEIIQPELDDSLKVKIGIVTSYIPNTITILPNEKKVISYYFSVRTNIPGDKISDPTDPSLSAFKEWKNAKSIQESNSINNNITPLMKEHIEEWETTIWNEGSIKVGGNDELSQIIQSSLYWILLSTRDDWPWSLSPGSLASNAYNGHSFWDCETWMYPPLLTFYPSIAESLIKYRFNHLEAAKAKARGYNQCSGDGSLFYDCVIWPPDPIFWNSSPMGFRQKYKTIVTQLKKISNPEDIMNIRFKNSFTNPKQTDDNYQGNCNYKGALFAWETGFTGAEVCPCMAGGTCLHEHHISGDIAFSVYQFWQATHNYTWLQEVGFPLAFEIANFWESRVHYDGYQYSILNVIPPDEAALGVNNSIYTNVIAQYSLNIATEFGNILSIPIPEIWNEIANNIVIPFDYSKQIHLEHDKFIAPLIKQADVILLGYPLLYPMDPSIRENDLNYYSDITSTKGPAMTWSVTAIGYLEILALRRMEAFCLNTEYEYNEELSNKAASYFFKSYQNAQPPYHIWTETPTGGAYNFITGAGGFLQGVISGYGGIRLKSDGLHIIHPMVPYNSNNLELNNVNFLYNNLDIKIEQNNFTIILQSKSHLTLYIDELNFCGDLEVLKIHKLILNESITFPTMSHLRLHSEDDNILFKQSNWFGKLIKKSKSNILLSFITGSLIGFTTIIFLIKLNILSK